MAETTPVSISLKYGIPGVLVTSGIALIAISVVHTTLLPVGMALLLLGILTYIARQIFIAIDETKEDIETVYYGAWEWGVVVAFILGSIIIAILVTWLFWPFISV